MSVFDRIAAQQPKERNAVWMVGEQLKDILRAEPWNQEIVARDLELETMSLAECEKKIKECADKHRKGSSSCVTPWEAEQIIREFYGISSQTVGLRTETPEILDLKDFL